jgi:hypothetical protein
MPEEGQNIFRAVIEAVDHATGPIKGIIEAVKAAAGVEETAHKKGIKGAEEHGHAFEGLTAHVRLLRGHFGNLSASIGEFGEKFSELVPAFAGLGAAGSLVGLFEMTEHASEAYSELNKAAIAAGVTAQQFSTLSGAAALADVPVDQMSHALFRLNRDIGDVASGKNKDVAALFHQVGIIIRDANGHLKSAADLLPQLADAFSKTHDQALKSRAAMALFGRAGLDMLPLLDLGKQKLLEYQAEVAKVRFVPSGEGAEGLEEFHRAWLPVKDAVAGFTTEIGTKLAPVLTPVIQQITEWTVANRDWVSTDIANVVGQIASAVRAIDLKAVIEGTGHWVHIIGDAIGFLGGFQTAIGAVVLVLGSPFLGAIAKIIEGIEGISRVLRAVALIAWSNPIIAAAAAVGIAAYELWAHWDWVKAQFAALFDWFTHQNAWVQLLLTAIAPLIAVPMEIIQHWEPIKAFFGRTFRIISRRTRIRSNR